MHHRTPLAYTIILCFFINSRPSANGQAIKNWMDCSGGQILFGCRQCMMHASTALLNVHNLFICFEALPFVWLFSHSSMCEWLYCSVFFFFAHPRPHQRTRFSRIATDHYEFCSLLFGCISHLLSPRVWSHSKRHCLCVIILQTLNVCCEHSHSHKAWYLCS